MSRQHYWLKIENIWITLADEPFAGGGEGNLYRVLAPREWRNYVAKLYHPHKISAEREQKINYLIQYPPEFQGENADGHPSVTWVKDALYVDNAFRGFLMPYTQGEKLEILTTPKIPRKHRNHWQRFDRQKSKEALRLRQLLGFNICIAIQQVHALGRYVLVDMKPDNIVVQSNGLVSVVDTDSVEVVEDGETLFEAPVATPEYTPPEHYKKLDYDPTQRQAWDRFGLGVILYKLFFGIHPFAASAGPPYDRMTTLQDKIEHGLFVHALQYQEIFTVVPPPHRQFHQLNPQLQELFLRCFVEGHQNPEARPTAEEWCAGILMATGDEALYERYRYVLTGEQQRSTGRAFPLPSQKLSMPIMDANIQPLLEMLQPLDLSRPSTPAPLRPADYVQFDPKKVRKRSEFFIVGLISILLTVTGVGVPFVFIMWLIFLSKINQSYKESRPYQEKTRAEKRLAHHRRSANRKRKILEKQYQNFEKVIKKTRNRIKQVTNQIQAELDHLKDYIQQQDQAVRQLNQKVLEQQRQIEQGYLKQLEGERLKISINPNQYKSLAELKRAINQENKEAIQELKRIQITNSESLMSRNIRLEIDQLLNEQKTTITNSTQQQLDQNDRKEQELLQKLWAKYREQADLKKNDKRIWDDIFMSPALVHRIRAQFQEIGLISVDQIDFIDINDGFFRLKNGQKVNWSTMSNRRTLLRNLARWKDELRLRAQSLSEEEQRIKQSYAQVRDTLTQEKRMALKGLTDVHAKELQKALIALPVEQLGEPYEQLQRQHQVAIEEVEALEIQFVAEAEGAVTDYEATYNAILESSRQQVEQSQARLIQLESQLEGHTQHFKRVGTHKKYLKLQQSIEAARETLANAQRASREVERYQNIRFKQYVETILKRK